MNVNDNISNEGIQPLPDKAHLPALPSRKSTETEEKTEDKGINVLSTGAEGNHEVFIPQSDIANSTSQDLLEIQEHLAVQGLNDVKEELENNAVGKERTPALASIEHKWLGLVEDLNNQTLYDMINERRSDILNTKNDYLEKQAKSRDNAPQLETGIAELEQKIKNNSGSDELHLMRDKLNSLKAEQSFIGSPEKELEVKELMKEGSIGKLGGKSGVYSLSGVDGKPKFIIKPMDEEIMTLNNPKGYALPHSVVEVPCEAKPGIPTYSALTNGELGYLVAKELGVEDITPRCYVMALTSEQFADITDGMDENEKKELIEKGGVPDREKLCLVQEFIPNSIDLGEHILSSTKMDQEALMNLNSDEKDQVFKDTMKNEVDRTMYDKAALLCWVTGEKDGNAGNFLISELDSKTKLRSIYKIDCAASFPEHNQDLTSGLSWAGNNYDNELSDDLITMINKIDTDNIANLMVSRNKSDGAVNAMKGRVSDIKYWANNKTENWLMWQVDQGFADQD